MTDKEYLHRLRVPSPEAPLRVLMSACLAGVRCGVDGTTNGEYATAIRILQSPNVKVVPFCPEDHSFGTPREMCDIHGGDGFAVLDGRAKVLSESGVDWTEGMVTAARRMVEVARAADVELCVMMDVSAACGSQVIYDGNRYAPEKKYQIGMGVCAALLLREGFKVISQRDFASLEILFQKLDTTHEVNPAALDHDQHPWMIAHFGGKV